MCILLLFSQARFNWHPPPLYDVIFSHSPLYLGKKTGNETRSHCLCFAWHSDFVGWFASDTNVFFSTRDVNSVKIAQLKRRTTPALLFKHYIFISEDLLRAETLIFLITKVNSISLFMCFVSSAAAACLSVFTNRHIYDFLRTQF